jgi:CRISPR-associated protein Cmr5
MLSIDFSVQKFAKNRIDENKNKFYRKEYKTLIRGLGPMIIQNGLYGTLVFYISKGKDHHNAVVEDIRLYLERINIVNANNNYDLLKKLEGEVYIQAQEKILDFVNWYRRYADIFIKE